MRLNSQLEAIRDRPGCRSCVHYRKHRSFVNGDYEYCAHPIYCEVKQDLLDGGADVEEQRTPIDFARGEGEPCGPEGNLYERKPLARLRRRLDRVKWTQLLGLFLVTVVVGAVGKRADLFLLPGLWIIWFLILGFPVKRQGE